MYESERRWRDFHNRMARIYDWGVRLWSLLWGFSDSGERRKLVSRLDLKPGQRVLEVGVGTGSNLRFVAEGVGSTGTMVGLDISIGMLRRCRQKLQSRPLRADLIEGEAAQLPIVDQVFDAVLHFGGINTFSDKKRAIGEMLRVAKPGARIVLSDEGLPPDKRNSLRRRLLLRLNPLYEHQPPMESIPPQVNDLRLSWFRGDACYVIDFAKP